MGRGRVRWRCEGIKAKRKGRRLVASLVCVSCTYRQLVKNNTRVPNRAATRRRDIPHLGSPRHSSSAMTVDTSLYFRPHPTTPTPSCQAFSMIVDNSLLPPALQSPDHLHSRSPGPSPVAYHLALLCLVGVSCLSFSIPPSRLLTLRACTFGAAYISPSHAAPATRRQ